jgi:hypothetical protein
MTNFRKVSLIAEGRFWLMLVAIVGVAGVAILEVSVRLTGMFPYDDSVRGDPEMGWAFRYRTPPDPATLMAGRPTIVMLGDSFTAPGGFISEAGRLMKEHGCPANFVNLAVSGYGEVQELASWRIFGRRYKADRVIVAAYLWNDLSDNLNDIFYSYISNINRPYISERGNQFVYINDSNYGLPEFLLRWSYAARWLTLMNLLRMHAQQYINPWSWVDFYRPKLNERGRRGYVVFAETLSRIRTEVSESGASLTLLAFDNGFTVMDTAAKDAAKVMQDFKLDIEYDSLDIDGPMRRVAEIASNMKIPFLDGRTALRRAEVETPGMYEPGLNGHFRAAADAVIGRLIAEHLLQTLACSKGHGL